MQEYKHGGNAHLIGIEHDFSANINPLGTLDDIKKAICNATEGCGVYPDMYCSELREYIARYEQVDSENIVCGNGAADIIYRIVNAVKPKSAVIFAPSFIEYEKALKENSSTISYKSLFDENSFDDTLCGVDICFLCSPNNPTGKMISAVMLKKAIDNCKKANTLLVVDECFIDFCEYEKDCDAKTYLCDNVAIIKAFTKSFAIPGVRIGYGIFGSVKLARAVQNTGQSWSTSTIAQEVGIECVKIATSSNYLSDTRKYVKEQKEYMSNALKSMGFFVYDSDVNFLLIKTNIDIYEAVKKAGFLIRKCDDFVFLDKNHYRIAIKSESENKLLIEAFRRIANG